MKCPICGAKMVDGKVCKYCSVTSDQVLQASNKEAKKAFKEKRHKDVCYTTNMPSDVNKPKLVLLTVFLGWFGVGDFYVGKNIKGSYCAVSFGLAIIAAIFNYLATYQGLGGKEVINVFMSITSYLMVVNLLFWAGDIIGFIFKTYKVPVVLPESEVKIKHHSIKK